MLKMKRDERAVHQHHRAVAHTSHRPFLFVINASKRKEGMGKLFGEDK
jgi:hypothetical protein